MTNPIWAPDKGRVKKSNMYGYMTAINQKFGKKFSTYGELYSWSVGNLSDFWASVWNFVDIKYSRRFDTVIEDENKMPGAKWFNGSRLNFAENLLRRRDEGTAIIAKREDGSTVKITYAELYRRTASLATAMRDFGITSDDVVAGFMPNMPETVIAMLAAASIGAMWSSCSPDFGTKGVLDRFGQIKPRILFTADGYHYNGKRFDCLEKVSDILNEIPSIQKTIVVPYASENPDAKKIRGGILYEDFISGSSAAELKFEQLPFGQPLYIMYSSGTTGLPKCMVQSAGGILINHLKELILHADLKRDDKIFYFTTCGWMMWNWLVSSLAVGAVIMLYDGSPFYPDAGAIFKFAEDEGMSIFGTSAKYISAIEQAGLKPAGNYNLVPLKTILSTGSPLTPESFDYVYRDVKKDVCLSSISGGTDLNGCFALGNPMGHVYRGELQCRGLGMKVEAFDENGRALIEKDGELVCTKPFPSMPLFFWNDSDGKKYHNAYFNVYPGVWRHGDYIRITSRGGVVISGRSDATLNPGGVRIGTAEIYRQLETLKEVADSIVVGQSWKDDERIILFIKPDAGVELTEELKDKIKKTIRQNTSPRHVPAKIIKIADIPYTINMKKSELAVKNIIHGKPVQNRDALANPESLELYREIKEIEED